MNSRTTLILFVIASGLGAYVWFGETNRPSSKEVRETQQLVAKVDRDKVDTVTIKTSEAKIVLRKGDDNQWTLQEPVKDRADSMVLNQLFTTAERLKHDARIDKPGAEGDKSQVKEFGLSGSATRLTFTGKDKPLELVLGKESAVEGKIYAKVEGAEPVYVISNELKNQISKKADDFRDRKLSDVAAGLVEKLVIKSPAGEIELEKKNRHWTLVKPLKARGDDSKVGDLIAQATTARIDSFVADSANLASFGIQEPRGTITLYVEGSKEPSVLQIGTEPKDEKEKVYAKLSSRDAVLVLPKSVAQLLETKPNDLRDKKLVRVETDIVDRITLEPAGRDKLVIARSGENWVRKTDKEQPANAAAANALLNELKSMDVGRFESDVASDLAKYGLDQPVLKLTLSAFASENTAESKAGEKPIVSVHFGKTDGDQVYAKLDDEPFIVTVPKSFLESIATDAIGWQPLSIYNLKPEDITAVELQRAEQPAISVERDKDKWKLAKGDGNINQSNAQSLVNTLATLRAVRWKGPAQPEHGLEKPTLTVRFKTANNTSGKLTLGSATPEEMTHASADGLSGVFEINRVDKDALELTLVDKPAPAPAPAAAAPGQPAQP
jgi:hypothetical protein